MKRLVILDFDGTIYDGDSMQDFAKAISPARYFFSMIVISFPFLLHLIGVLKRDFLKKVFLKINFKNYSRHDLEQHGALFYEKNKNKIFKHFNSYWQTEKLSDQTTFVIVSGSSREWLLPFCKEFNTELICTELAYDETNHCKGSWVNTNMIGEEKVKAIQAQFDLEQFDSIIAFGDSKQDKKLEVLSSEFYMNHFNKK